MLPIRPAGPFPVCATRRLRLDERVCPYPDLVHTLSPEDIYRLLWGQFAVAVFPLRFPPLIPATAPTSLFSPRTAPLFTALLTQLCFKSCRRKGVLSKTKSCQRELGHSPSTRPFRTSFPILVRRLFPDYGCSAMSMARAFASASSRAPHSPCLLSYPPRLIYSDW